MLAALDQMAKSKRSKTKTMKRILSSMILVAAIITPAMSGEVIHDAEYQIPHNMRAGMKPGLLLKVLDKMG